VYDNGIDNDYFMRIRTIIINCKPLYYIIIF